MGYTIAESEFTDLKNTDWKVKIVSLDSPAINLPFNLGPDGFSLTYDFDEYDRCKPIVGSRVQITLFHPTTTPDSALFDIIYNALDTSEEGTFRIEIYRDQDSANELWWAGAIMPEQTVIPDDYPHAPVTITAVDGLANLKGIDYNNNGVAYTGTALVMEHLHNLIQKLHISDVWSASDVELKFFEDYIGKEYKDHIDGAQNKQLENCKVHHNTFYNKDNDGVKQYFSSYEVLESLAIAFNVSVFMAQGSIWWAPLGAIQSHASGSTSIANFMLGDGTRTYNTSANVTTGAIFGSNSPQWEKLKGWERTSAPSFKEVVREREYQGNKPIVRDSIYTKIDLLAGTVLDDEDIEYPVETRFLISGFITYKYPGDGTSTDDDRVARLKLAIKLRVGDSGGTEKYLARAVTFDDTNVSYAQFYDSLSDTDPDTPQFWDPIYAASSWESGVSTTDIISNVFDKRLGTNAPNDGDAGDINYLPFSILTSELAAQAIGLQLSATISGLNVYGVNDADLVGATAEVTVGEFAVHIYDQDSPQEFQTLDIKATNPDSARYIHTQGSTLVGDRITDNDLGTISINNGTTYVDSSQWTNLQSSTAELSINGLGVRERLAANENAKRIERGTLFQRGSTYIHPYTILTNTADSGNFYQVTGLNYIANRCEYDIECMYLSRNITGITVSQDNSKGDLFNPPPGPAPSTKGPGPDNIVSDNSTKLGFVVTDTYGITGISTSTGSAKVGINLPVSLSAAGTEIITINTSGVMAPLTDGASGEFLKTDGSGALTWGAAGGGGGGGWFGSTTLIKVMPTQFFMNDDYNRAPVMVEDDVAGYLGIRAPSTATELYAFLPIPSGYKATHVQVYTSSNKTDGVEVLRFSQVTGATQAKGTGDFNTLIDITDITSASGTNITIKLLPASLTTVIYGADITIAAV